MKPVLMRVSVILSESVGLLKIIYKRYKVWILDQYWLSDKLEGR